MRSSNHFTLRLELHVRYYLAILSAYKTEQTGRGSRSLKTEVVWGPNKEAVLWLRTRLTNHFLGPQKTTSLNCWHFTKISITAAPGTNLGKEGLHA